MKTSFLLRNLPSFTGTAVLIGVLATQAASGQILFSDNFNSYTDDTSLLTSWSRVSGTTASIFLTPDPVNSGNQTIEQTTAAGRLRHVVSGVVPTASSPLSFSFDFYDPNGGTASGRVFGEIRNSASATGLFAAGVYNSVNLGTLDITKYQARALDSGGWIQLSTARSVGWHNFRFEIGGNTASLYIDNILVPEFASLTYAGNVTYDWLHIGSALTGSTEGYFDNVTLSIVPEPSAAALALIGLGILARRSMRKS